MLICIIISVKNFGVVLSLFVELKKGRDFYINFLKGLCYFTEGSIFDAIRDTEPLLNNRDLKFSTVNALIHYRNNYSIANNVKK